MIRNDETTLKERLAEVMRGADDICHKLTNRSGIMGVKFDQGIYKGKFIPLNTRYDIEHLKIFIDQTMDDMIEEYNNTDDMISLFTNVPDGAIEVTIKCDDTTIESSNKTMDSIRKLTKNIERFRRESIRKETEKIIYDAECDNYFDYIVAVDDEFRGLVFYNPRKSDPQFIKLENALLDNEEYYKKIQDCVDIIIEYEDDIADEYAKHYVRVEKDSKKV